MRHARRTGLAALGNALPQSKLNPDLVREIRRRYAAGEGYRKLGKAFNVQPANIVSVVKRRTWDHVD